MNLVYPDAFDKLRTILDSFTSQLYPFIDTIIDFVTTPLYDVIYDFVTFFPLGEFFGAPFLLVSVWLFPDDVTLLEFVFGLGIGVYLFWNIAVWIAKLITSRF